MPERAVTAFCQSWDDTAFGGVRAARAVRAVMVVKAVGFRGHDTVVA